MFARRTPKEGDLRSGARAGSGDPRTTSALVRGRATLGDLALFSQAFHQGQRLLRTLLESMGQLYANSLFLNNLFEFLDLRPRVVDRPHPVPAPQSVTRSIRFEHVTFRYPGTERETDAALRLARATDWRQQPGGAWHGIGQRMLTTDRTEIALLDMRVLAFDTARVESGTSDADAPGNAVGVTNSPQANG